VLSEQIGRAKKPIGEWEAQEQQVSKLPPECQSSRWKWRQTDTCIRAGDQERG
jgi:hypothetical protein